MPEYKLPHANDGGDAIAQVILDVGSGERTFDDADQEVQLRNAVLFG